MFQHARGVSTFFEPWFFSPSDCGIHRFPPRPLTKILIENYSHNFFDPLNIVVTK